MREKYFNDFLRKERIPYDTYQILDIDKLLLTKCTCSVVVVTTLGYEVKDFKDIVIHELNALSELSYKSKACIRRINHLWYVLNAMGMSQLIKKHNSDTTTCAQFNVAMHQFWGAERMQRSLVFA